MSFRYEYGKRFCNYFWPILGWAVITASGIVMLYYAIVIDGPFISNHEGGGWFFGMGFIGSIFLFGSVMLLCLGFCHLSDNLTGPSAIGYNDPLHAINIVNEIREKDPLGSFSSFYYRKELVSSGFISYENSRKIERILTDYFYNLKEKN